MATEWNGEGIPPAGTECEARWREKEGWAQARMLSDDVIAVLFNGRWSVLNLYNYRGFKALEFRPLQSEEQKQVAEIAEIMQKNNSYQGKAQAVYDAGFRKVVE